VECEDIDRTTFAADVEGHLGRHLPGLRLEQCDGHIHKTCVASVE
jgi:hypothetical protein